MLTQFRDNIWTSSTNLKLLGLELGSRMTVIKLDDLGTLFVHSPIKLLPELKAELDKLGTVAYVVAPNKWHHLFVNNFKQAYPNAKFFCAPGLEVKRKDFEFDQVISSEQSFPWNPVLEHKIVAGVPILNEVVFYHASTQTLVVTDLALHICKSPSRITRMIFKAMGAYGKFGWAKLEKLLYIRNKSSFNKSIEDILKWEIDGILLTHGELIQSGGQQRLCEAFQEHRPQA